MTSLPGLYSITLPCLSLIGVSSDCNLKVTVEDQRSTRLRPAGGNGVYSFQTRDATTIALLESFLGLPCFVDSDWTPSSTLQTDMKQKVVVSTNVGRLLLLKATEGSLTLLSCYNLSCDSFWSRSTLRQAVRRKRCHFTRCCHRECIDIHRIWC